LREFFEEPERDFFDAVKLQRKISFRHLQRLMIINRWLTRNLFAKHAFLQEKWY
jgi:hypothetical protein